LKLQKITSWCIPSLSMSGQLLTVQLRPLAEFHRRHFPPADLARVAEMLYNIIISSISALKRFTQVQGHRVQVQEERYYELF
jgi:hypothetical protein